MGLKAPQPFFHARCQACWVMLAVVVLVVASFISLDLQWAKFLAPESMQRMGRFIAELLVPSTDGLFLKKLLWASVETLAMSALGTLLAAVFGLVVAVPASQGCEQARARWRMPMRLLLNALRAIPELVWAALLLVSAGLGPFAGTLALGAHTTGVLGRLFTEAIENAPPGPAFALHTQGAGCVAVMAYANLPQVLPQLISYTLYRWENNIRAAAVLGVVGAGGLGQMLAFHLGLFQMAQTSAVLIAMFVLVALVDTSAALIRRALAR